MLDETEALFWTKFTAWWMTFHINDSGKVICDDGMDLGHIEECLEEGKTIMDLIELCETIDFWV